VRVVKSIHWYPYWSINSQMYVCDSDGCKRDEILEQLDRALKTKSLPNIECSGQAHAENSAALSQSEITG